MNRSQRDLLVAALSLAGGIVAMTELAAANSNFKLSAAPASGAAPLTVVFSGGVGSTSFFGGVLIEFGDGARTTFCRPGQPCETATVEHRYAERGEFVATLIGRGEGPPRVLASVKVKVD